MFEKEERKAVRLPYWLHLPPGYGETAEEKWPLILFLHGAGERGDNLALVKTHGIARVVEEQPDFPFMTVSPQCPMNSWWAEQLEVLSRLLDEITAQYAVDEERVYLTGLSLGGYGAWHLGSLEPERFAAVVPVCGGGRSLWMYGFPERVCALKQTPVWAFHGADDEVVPLAESKVMVSALRACGGDVRFTIYPNVGHDSWTETYNNPRLYEWMLRQRLGEKG